MKNIFTHLDLDQIRIASPCNARWEDMTGDDGRIWSRVTQWDRQHWGEGGNEFHWWCTEAPEAFGASEPVYRAMAGELRAIAGDAVYSRLSDYLDSLKKGRAPLAHPVVRKNQKQK